ncbi:calcium-activated BK potassium channel alpha subunit-domain-containing protein [Phycomyces blakesleeanus]
MFNNSHYISAAKRILFSNSSIVLFVNLDLLVDILFCLAYLVEMKQESDVDLDPPWMYKWRSYDLWIFCLCLTVWNTGSFLMRVFMNVHPLSVFLSFRFFIEMMTTIPFLASNFVEHGQYLYVPYFLRSWVLLLRVKSWMKIKLNLQMTDKPVDALKAKLIQLIITIAVLLYNGMSAFQYCEVTFGTVNYTILESLYVVMVTLSTVGYGDITPSTEGSRIVMMLLIVISLAVLPSLLADSLSTLRKRQDGGGSVSKGTLPFILIVGTFTPEQANDILDGFLNREHIDTHLNVVFLDINRPTEELKLMERNSMWGHRVQFLHGSVLNEKTLQRAQARYAKAIITMSDNNTPEPAKEDERNTVRLWSLYCYTTIYNVPIYTYNLYPSTAIYQKVAKEIICLREFKQYLLAMNCRCRGASTLLTNLLHQREPRNKYDEPWQAQYDDGSCNEIYVAPPEDCLVGLTFGDAAWILFKEFQVILFAIKLATEDQDDHIMLNPGEKYTIRAQDLCVYMAESAHEINDIRKMTTVYAWKAVKAMRNRRSANKPPAFKSLLNPNKTLNKKLKHSSSTETMVSHHSRVSSTSHPVQQNFCISRLPSSKHALLTGNRALVSRLGTTNTISDEQLVEDNSLPLCYLLEEPATLDDLVIKSADGMDGHILVCLHRRVINIFKFIYNLRSPYMRPNELQDIILLCATLPNKKTFDLIKQFPRVFFMVGNCRHPDDLLRAGVKRAKQVVVMSEKENLDQYEKNSDSPAVMTSHIMDLLLQEPAEGSYRIVNLVERSNIRFMHLLEGKDVAEEIDVFYTPAYAAGDVVVDSLLSNVLLSQTYYKPDIVSIIKTLCGMPGSPHVNNSTFSSDTTMDGHYVTSVKMPACFVDKPFAFLFETFVLDYDLLPLGLLRAPNEEMGNELPFVYTNPVPSLILKETDWIYFITSSEYSL